MRIKNFIFISHKLSYFMLHRLMAAVRDLSEAIDLPQEVVQRQKDHNAVEGNKNYLHVM